MSFSVSSLLHSSIHALLPIPTIMFHPKSLLKEIRLLKSSSSPLGREEEEDEDEMSLSD